MGTSRPPRVVAASSAEVCCFILPHHFSVGVRVVEAIGTASIGGTAGAVHV